MSDQQHNPCFDSEQLNKGLALSITKGELSSALLKVEQLQQRIKELEQFQKENTELRAINFRLRGKIYDLQERNLRQEMALVKRRATEQEKTND